jgi:hypothetical protein
MLGDVKSFVLAMAAVLAVTAAAASARAATVKDTFEKYDLLGFFGAPSNTLWSSPDSDVPRTLQPRRQALILTAGDLAVS